MQGLLQRGHRKGEKPGGGAQNVQRHDGHNCNHASSMQGTTCETGETGSEESSIQGTTGETDETGSEENSMQGTTGETGSEHAQSSWLRRVHSGSELMHKKRVQQITTQTWSAPHTTSAQAHAAHARKQCRRHT